MHMKSYSFGALVNSVTLKINSVCDGWTAGLCSYTFTLFFLLLLDSHSVPGHSAPNFFFWCMTERIENNENNGKWKIMENKKKKSLLLPSSCLLA